MDINPKIKEDILDILFRATICLDERDADEISRLSDMTIHNASIFQDGYSIQIAICLYALSKIIAAKPQTSADFSARFTQARELVEKEQWQSYGTFMDKVLARISELDSNLNRYRADVLSQAQIKKGCSLYSHGLSVCQSAALTGASQWELYNYIGKTTIHDDGSNSLENLDKRLEFTRELFSLAPSAKSKPQMNKTIVFDTGPIITMAMTNLLSLLPRLKSAFAGDFLIPSAVHRELIERPLATRSHKLEAFQVFPYINDGTLQVIDTELLRTRAAELSAIANNIYWAQGQPIQIVHEGELEALALMLIVGASTMVVDERTMRYLIETPSKLLDRLEYKLHTKVTVNKADLERFKLLVKQIHTIRSVELLTYAFESGLFSHELNLADSLPHNRTDFYEGLLWGLKYAGCGVSDYEIDDLLKHVSSPL